MSLDFVSILVFVLALSGMIFVHELGHFLAARLFKIEVEEFGFGIPPRLLTFWRGKGSILLKSGKRLEIPRNFDLPFGWSAVLKRDVNITADQVGDSLVLRTLEFDDSVWGKRQPVNNPVNMKDIFVDENGQVVEPPGSGASKSIVKVGVRRGQLEWSDGIVEVHPGTAFTLNWLPLGGFVRPKGENDPSVPGGLAAAHPWKRITVLLAGPLMNLITAVIVFGLVTALEGVPVPGPIRLENIAPDSPAERAGLQVNDVILAINGQPVDETREISMIIAENLDRPLELRVRRGDEILTITATPLSSRLPTEGPLGITMVPPTRPATAGEVIQVGFGRTAIQAAAIVYLPIALIQGAINPADARPVGLKGIFDLVDSAVQEDTQSRQGSAGGPVRPTHYTLLIIGLLSVSLGILNLLPIPALDGGRILFTLPELLFHRRIPPEAENIVNGVAMLLLIVLMLYINALDLINPIEINFP